MSNKPHIYCLDANVLIEAWQKYYSPELCPDYWDFLIDLGKDNTIFIPEEVYKEIVRTEDDLSKWLKNSNIPIREISERVIACLRKIYATNPIHRNLVDNIKGRSLADPWVIAHAINEEATVVTKEAKITALNSNRIKIPNVCDNMGVRCMNDFEFIAELGIKFTVANKSIHKYEQP
jgi:predicted nucleic acid-binding protein